MTQQSWTSELRSALQSWAARRGQPRLNRQMAKRMVVDGVLVNLALALFARCLVASSTQTAAFIVERTLTP
jgi:hypothetical protein